jgi:nitrogen fixation protein FixH
MSDRDASRKAGLRIFLYFLTGFLIVAAVNVFFIYKAVTTHSGEVTDNAYQRGLAYNKTLDEAAEEQNLGWKASLTAVKQGSAYLLTLAATDKNGAPLSFDGIRATIRRPARAKDDMDVTFAARAPGVYTATAALPLPGLWEIDAVMTAGGRTLHFSKRTVVE